MLLTLEVVMYRQRVLLHFMKLVSVVTDRMLQPIPSTAATSKSVRSSRKESQTRITVLENGMRVASEDNYGSFFTVGGEALVTCLVNS